MKHSLLAMLCSLAFMNLSGCCCAPQICMPGCGFNPYWAEDLQASYCRTACHLNSQLYHMRQSLHYSMSQWNSQTECACRQHAHSRTAKPTGYSAEPKILKSTWPRASAATSESAANYPAENGPCDQQCSSCKQKPCRCGKCQGFEAVDSNAPPSVFTPALPRITPNSPPNMVPPAPPAPNTHEPVPVPPAPYDSVDPPQQPEQPLKKGEPTPIPIPVPKVTPGETTQKAPAIPDPNADPSVPLERQLNLNQVGFRRAELDKPLYNGWKPVTKLPDSLKSN